MSTSRARRRSGALLHKSWRCQRGFAEKVSDSRKAGINGKKWNAVKATKDMQKTW